MKLPLARLALRLKTSKVTCRRTNALCLWPALLATFVAALLLAPQAHATLLLAQSLEEMVSQADHVVVVAGLGETSRWDRYGRIVSDMRLRVADTAKGPFRRGQEITVTRLGGDIDDVGMTVAGEARIAVGERAVLFLDVVDADTMRVSNMSLGLFPVVTQQGVASVLPSGTGLELVVHGDHGALAPSVAPLQGPMPLSDFLAVVRELAASR
jgi:hypothetical protein